MKPVADLVPHPRNPNRHPQAQIALLAKIIATQGWRAPITLSERSGYIIRGHARLAAAKLLGLTEVPVDVQVYEAEADEIADLVADNRISELSDLSQSDVKALLADLDKLDFDLELAGYDDAAWDTLRNAFVPDESMVPSNLPDVGMVGTDPSTGRFILIYRDDEEKKFWQERVGINGDKIIWTKDEVS
jgi:hypothetical protein